MTKPWLIASNNPGKSRDLALCLGYYGITATQYLATQPRLDFPVETTTSYVDNAVMKAKFAARKLGVPVIADDSGLEIPALPDEFGVTTARDLGVKVSGYDRNAEIIAAITPLTFAERVATMRATLVAAWPDGRTVVSQGTLTGYLLTHQIGGYSGGFDRLFWLPTYGRTLAEIPDVWRLPLTHRGQAAQQLSQQL